jgi:hypothetical protein
MACLLSRPRAWARDWPIIDTASDAPVMTPSAGAAAGRLVPPYAPPCCFTNTKTGRGRIVFDRSRDLFIVYADRKLLTPAMIAHIATQFHLPADRTEVQSDWHYQSNETPNVLGT